MNALPSELPAPEITPQFLQTILGPKYRNIRFFREGGTRTLYLADWSGEGTVSKKRVIKVDKPGMSERAQRHQLRGCTTRNEALTAAAIDEIEAPNIIQTFDYEDLAPHGYPGALSIEQYFPSRSLEEIVAEKTLSKREFQTFFDQVLQGELQLKRHNFYHRDLKPSNILRNEKGMVRIVDLANARKRDETQAKYLPTSGGHFVMDPLLIAGFTGETRAYGEQSELYALGSDMLFSLIGAYAVEYDPDRMTATRVADGESLLENGMLSIDKHERAIEDALKRLPKEATAYAPIIKRCLTVRKEDRFSSIDELIDAFDDAGKPTLGERLKRSWMKIAAAGVLALSLGSGLVIYDTEQRRTYEQDLSQARKFPVVAEWDGETLDIDSNYVSVDAKVQNTRRIRESDTESYPRSSFVRAASGDTLKVIAYLHELPMTNNESKMLPGRIYFQGYEGKYFSGINVMPHNMAIDWDMSYPMPAEAELTVPSDMTHGTYNLIFEAYSPHDTRYGYINETAFPPPGTVIVRKRIPVVIGDPAMAVMNHRLIPDMPSYVSWRSVESDQGAIPAQYSFLSMFEDARQEVGKQGGFSNTRGGALPLPLSSTRRPDGTTIINERTGPITLATLEGDKIVQFDFVPVHNNVRVNPSTQWWVEWKLGFIPIPHRRTEGGYARWEFAQIDETFYRDCITLREELFAQYHKR